MRCQNYIVVVLCSRLPAIHFSFFLGRYALEADVIFGCDYFFMHFYGKLVLLRKFFSLSLIRLQNQSFLPTLPEIFTRKVVGHTRHKL